MIDPNRKGFDYFVCAFYKRYFDEEKGEYSKWYFADVVCQRKPYKMLKEEILAKIIKNKTSKISLEINTSNELADYLTEDLQEKGYFDAEIDEVYSTDTKEVKIQNARQDMVDEIIYPAKGLYDVRSEMGIAMTMMTTYSINRKNEHDDFPDCDAMFTMRNCSGGLENLVQILDDIRL